MLRYLGFGQRPLGDCPLPPHKRVNWEFLAVIRGKCTPFFHAGYQPSPVDNRLWLFPPGYAHGWLGESGKKCHLVVVHFNTVPAALERIVQERGFLSTRLTVADKRFLARLAEKLKPHYWRPIWVSDIHTERALLDLSLLVLRDVRTSRQPAPGSGSMNKILLAETWLREHLAERPSIAEAARATGISPSQLRRLFHGVRKASPKRALHKLKFERAMQLMAHSNVKLATVAAECGFTSASNFCRAFKAFNGNTPTVWRREIYIQYKKPREDEKTNYARHGRRYRTP